jgi:hypothetical protein
MDTGIDPERFWTFAAIFALGVLFAWFAGRSVDASRESADRPAAPRPADPPQFTWWVGVDTPDAREAREEWEAEWRQGQR